MDEVVKIDDVPKLCPQCHTRVRDTDYYCFNCGRNLKPAAKSTTVAAQVVLYAKSALLPPLGLWYALVYLKQPNQKSKVVGIVAIVITLVSLLLALKLTQDLVNIVNKQVNEATTNFYSY